MLLLKNHVCAVGLFELNLLLVLPVHRMAAIIKLHDIVSFLGSNAVNLMKKGENLLSSRHLKEFSYDEELQHIEGKVKASQRAMVYHIVVSISFLTYLIIKWFDGVIRS